MDFAYRWCLVQCDLSSVNATLYFVLLGNKIEMNGLKSGKLLTTVSSAGIERIPHFLWL